ncbi:MAG TPA: tyrosine-type recombinase/integrase [Steroidobacteraceae bacterium]|nr:tyrosine-type recombinase/integrase [Steroidobacteraceae bacterium]
MNAVVPSAQIAADQPLNAPVMAALGALQAWDGMAKRAYSANTRRAQKADAVIFQAFCERVGAPFFPAAPQNIRSFIEDCVLQGKKPATVRRYVATIARLHVGAGLASPCASEPVQLALREMALNTTARQRQAWALGWKEIKEFIDSAGQGLRAERERALLCVAYDTMARRAELVALDVADIRFMPDGSGTVLIRRSKTDQEGQGAMGYLSRDTVRWLCIWLTNAKITQGAVFRRLVGQHRVGERLHADIISDIYKRVARWVGLPAKLVAQVSGHSIRIGATQDLLALNIDLGSVMQAGRWKSTAMPMRYGEQVLAARGGMARAAQAQGRDALPTTPAVS